MKRYFYSVFLLVLVVCFPIKAQEWLVSGSSNTPHDFISRFLNTRFEPVPLAKSRFSAPEELKALGISYFAFTQISRARVALSLFDHANDLIGTVHLESEIERELCCIHFTRQWAMRFGSELISDGQVQVKSFGLLHHPAKGLR